MATVNIITVGAVADAAVSVPDRAAIDIDERNWEYYAPNSDGINWLGSGIPAQEYRLRGTISADSLGINSAGTSLTVDTRDTLGDPAPVLTLNKDLRVDSGSLNVRTQEMGVGIVLNPLDVMENETALPLFQQTGGAFTVDSQGDSQGIQSMRSFQMSGGNLSVTARDEAGGISLIGWDSGSHLGSLVLYRQTGGSVHFESDGTGAVAVDSNQSAEISGGNLSIHTQKWGKGIVLLDVSSQFHQKDGTITVNSEDNSTGIDVVNFRMDGGLLRLQGDDSGRAVDLGSGWDEQNRAHFLFNGGTIQIAAKRAEAGSVRNSFNGHTKDDSRNFSVYGDEQSQAVFGSNSILQPIVTIDAEGRATTGLMSFGEVKIAPHAKLDIQTNGTDFIKNSGSLTTTRPIDVTFLESRNAPIDGTFTTLNKQDKLFYSYEAVLSEYKQYYRLHLQSKNKNQGVNMAGSGSALRVSDIVSGNNQRAAKAIEQTLAKRQVLIGGDAQSLAFASPNTPHNTEDSETYQKLNILYDMFYNSNKGDEAKIARALSNLSPYQATRLPAVSLGIQTHFTDDMRQSLLSITAPANSGHTGSETEADKAAWQFARNSSKLWDFWLKPTGSHDKYRAENSAFSTLTADYGGMNFGAATNRENLAFGIAGGFDAGRLHGTNSYHADMRHFVLGGGAAYAWQLSDTFQPVADINLSYGNARFKQRRRDSFNMDNRAPVTQNIFSASAALTNYYGIENYYLQLAPQIGLDYSYIYQNSWHEKGKGLPLAVKGKGFSALRPKIGGSVLWSASPLLSLNAYGYYRYDILDVNMNIDARLRSEYAMVWKTRGENINRSSFNGGLGLSYYMIPNIHIFAAYDISVQEKRTSQQFSAKTKMAF